MTVHSGVDAYQIPAGASPRRKFRIARAHLCGGLATTARRLMDEVVAEEPDGGAERFYWLLAFFSGRAFWELSDAERGRLGIFLNEVALLDCGTWQAGVDLIRRLAGTVHTDDEDPSALVKEFDALPPGQRAKILRHLERVLAGRLKDELWRQSIDQASALQSARGRAERVWKFFEPEPAPPRTRMVRPAQPAPGQPALAVLATALLLLAVGTIAWLLLQSEGTSALAALLVGLGGGAVALANGAEWRFRNERLRTKEREYRGYPTRFEAGPAGAFAAEVERLYQHYFLKYAPPDAAADRWLLATGGIGGTLRDELVEVHRDRRTSPDELKWLIRYQVRVLRQRWMEGTLTGFRRRWATPPSVRAGVVLGLAAVAGGGCWALEGAVQVRGLTALAAGLLAVPAGCVAAAGWLRIIADDKRVVAERAERDRRMTAYWFEFQRWQHRLADRPDDGEMATWLDADRRIVLDRSMRMHQLRWNEISAYASLGAPGFDSPRARVPNGPWRYARYQLFLFLLTADGVRQVVVGVDLATGSFHAWQRSGYRFDAVAAVRVIEHDGGARHFELSLVDGDDLEIGVSRPETAGAGEDSGVLADAELDATGLRATVFVLEGVAVDGHGWWDGPSCPRAN
jgi:hypothetical protein